MESVRDFVRAEIPLIQSLPAYTQIAEAAMRRHNFADDGFLSDDETRAAHEVLDRLLTVVEEAGRRVDPDLREVARRGAATVLLERMPAIAHHFSLMDILRKLGSTATGASRATKPHAITPEPPIAPGHNSADSQATTSPARNNESRVVADPVRPDDVVASALPCPKALSDAFAIAARLRDPSSAIGALAPDTFREAWHRYLSIRCMGSLAMAAAAKRVSEALPLREDVAPLLSDLHALLLAWQVERQILSGAEFARLLAVIAFVEAHESRLASEGLVSRDGPLIVCETALCAALATANYGNPLLCCVPGADIFSVDDIVEFALEIDQELRDVESSGR